MPFATIAAAFVMFMSPMSGANQAAVMDASMSVNTATSKETVLEASTETTIPMVSVADQSNSKVVEQEVRAFYKETPILAEIAFCESTFRQLNSNGDLVRGKVDSRDVGVMQINERFHLEQSAKLGYNIHTLEGNLAYAKWLYGREGTVPWNSSKDCWAEYQ